MVLKTGKTPEYFLPLMVLLFTILSNLTEAPLLARNTIYWVLYVSSTLSLCDRIRPGQTV
jgi:O-antigen ligase